MIVQLRAQIEAALYEELLGVFSRGGGDPVIVLSAIHVLKLLLDELAECSQDLLDENICLDPHVLLIGILTYVFRQILI